MTDRIIDLTTQPARLSVRHRQLVIETGEQPAVTIPLGELAALVLSCPQIILTQPVLAGLAEAGGVCVVCDGKSRPISIMVPLVQHHVQTERLTAQARATPHVKKKLWRQIVRNKIESQAQVLRQLHGDEKGLPALVRLVRLGDSTNVEAVASKRYWRHIFGDPSFRRDVQRQDQNRFLNYGYAILRAVTARALIATGLHPSLGIHHHNRYNPFCLADDLMEPFRPRVDLHVARMLSEISPEAPLSPQVKARLLGFLEERYVIAGKRLSLFDTLARAASSLADALADTQAKSRTPLVLPDWKNHAAE